MKKLIIIAIVALFSMNAQAQRSVFQLDWNIAVPMGELADFIEDESYSGLRIGGRGFIYDNFSVGGYTGWQVLYDTFSGTMRIENEDGIIDLTGDQYRYLNIYPLMVNAHVYVGEDYGVRPYIGTALGMNFVNERIAFGVFDVSQTSTHFALSPEVGAFIPIGVAGGGINLSASYNHIFATEKLDATIQTFNISIGLMFMN